MNDRAGYVQTLTVCKQLHTSRPLSPSRVLRWLRGSRLCSLPRRMAWPDQTLPSTKGESYHLPRRPLSVFTRTH